MNAALAVYRAVGGAAVALGLPSLVLRARPEERRERLGEVPIGGDPPPLWIHAASLGEIGAAGALVRALRAGEGAGGGAQPAGEGGGAPLRIALSATTRAGRERAARTRPDVGPFFLPIDAPRPVRRALDRLRPRAIVLVETELWPALLHEAAARGIPWGLASARLGERAAPRRRAVRGMYASMLRTARGIGARSEEDAARWRELGAPAEIVRVTGDLKTSLEVPEFAPPPAPGGLFRWIAACTRPGEEEIVLAATDRLEALAPRGETWIAPRHRERFEEVAVRITRSGRRWRRWRDAPASDSSGWSVVLVDELDVLAEAYRETAAAFVGGSLVPLGGHNPLEAAAAGRPVLVGPHTSHVAAAVEALVAGGAARCVATAEALAREVAALARDPAGAESRGRAARGVAARSSSAARDTVAFLAERGILR